MSTQVIRFGEDHPTMAAFCNVALYGLHLHDCAWPSVAHYLVGRAYGPAMVSRESFWTASPAACERVIRRLERGGAARARAHPKWAVYKDEWLREALEAKVTQHLDLERMLLDTGKARLEYVRAGTPDRWLSIGENGHGHNMLGRMLERVRRRISGSELYELNRRHLTAIENVEKLARRDSNRVKYLNLLGRYYYDAGWYERARAVFRISIRIEPDDWVGYYWLACAHIALGEDEQAVEPLKWLIRDDPEDTDFYRMMSDVCFRLGRTVQAKVYAVRADRIDEATD